MDGAYYINAAELSQHQDGITEQKYCAQRLQDNFRRIKQLSSDAIVVDRDVLRRFQHLSGELDDLKQYYVELNQALEMINEDAQHISDKVGILLDDHLEYMSKKHLAE